MNSLPFRYVGDVTLVPTTATTDSMHGSPIVHQWTRRHKIFTLTTISCKHTPPCINEYRENDHLSGVRRWTRNHNLITLRVI